ncbi:unnamed protein product [Polarella glacialis]|uniref:Alpha-type protein kinase domain-containing protein n=1 Tax=Polarella glacialis TaxID=89957 RepID=A0A813G345_POLGL|nr:unnamed protein product [Polarella glacialis]
MLTQDCKEENGWSLSRMDAVLKTCSDFVTESMMNREDVYSFVTFNEESVLHFSCQSAFNACEQLSNLRPIAEKQTLFAMGIRGIEAAIKREKKGLPSHVVFLSDGEPTDPDTYLRDLHVLLRKRAGSTLKIYTVGFGESAKVNAREGDFTYLQQLASLGRGHFQRCGASLCSLQGAFTALTSTISRTRESSTRRSTTERETLGTSGPESGASAAYRSPVHKYPHQCAILVTRVAKVGLSEVLHRYRRPNMEDAIAEGDEESDLESEGSQHEEALNGSRSKFPDVQFELPAPDIIFKDVMNKDLWRNFTAAKTSFKFNGRSFARSAEVSKVFLRHKPFMKGGMRLVYGMVLEEGARAPGKAEHMMCAKRTFEDLEKDHGFQAHSAFCRSTAVAKYFGQKFRKDTQQALAAAVQFGFLDCHLYSPVGTGEDGYHFCGEAYLNGHFVKLNSNAGYVNETDYNEHSMIAQAFSHYTFDKSHGELLVVDLQGICGEVKDDPYFLLTDPQVHSRCGTFDKFGSGDHGDQGVSTFFNKHRCGPICKALNLRKDYEVRPPTHIISIPGVQSCLDFLQPRRFWMKKISGANQFIMPKQASKDKDWLDIQLWARPHSGEKFKELVNKSLEVYYEASRQILFLEQKPAWTAEVWKEKLDQWQSSSGAAAVAYPSDWRETAPSELWVFSEKSESGWVDHKKANWALSKIREELESSPPDHVPGQSPTSKPAKQARF